MHCFGIRCFTAISNSKLRQLLLLLPALMLALVLLGSQPANCGMCYVCPGNEMKNCAPSDFDAKVKYELFDCDKTNTSNSCGKLISWSTAKPVLKGYVGLRETVRQLEYKYCANSAGWTGCYDSDGAVTTTRECVCSGDACNSGLKLAPKLLSMACPLVLLALLVAA